MRLIDADRMKQNIKIGEEHPGITAMLEGWIDCQTTIDAEPVRHGHWTNLPHSNWYECSECKATWDMDVPPEESGMYFCPNCGAKMDEEEMNG